VTTNNPRPPRQDKGKNRKPPVKQERIQAVIRANDPRALSAIEVYRAWRNQGHSALYVVTEALCALGEMTGNGWKASPSMTQVAINAEMYKALTDLQTHIRMLSQMDFNGAPNQGAIQNTINKAQNFTVNALNLTGATMMFNEDED
jgi:hypothetical protein